MKTYNCIHCSKETKFDIRKINKYCGQRCQLEYQYIERIKQWLVDGRDWTGKVPNWVRRYLEETFGDRCSVCGIEEYNSMPIVLEVDHIDGSHLNNSVSNLRLICPNCHSQTHTYKNRNKGKGRHTRRVRYSLDKSY